MTRPRARRHRPTTPAAPVDGAKIVKTGTLDLQVAHGTLRVAVNRVTGVAVGIGGYIADSKTTYGGADPTAQITLRVPVDDFETAIARLDALPGVKVLSESEDGTDVTGQFSDLQAQLAAATAGRDALLTVLSTRSRSATSSQSATGSRPPRPRSTNCRAASTCSPTRPRSRPSRSRSPRSPSPQCMPRCITRRSKPAWPSRGPTRARVSPNAVEWLIARSGAALIILLAALALLFGIRYLYPVVRRGLV